MNNSARQAGAARFDLNSQYAGAINNVGGDQYTAYVAHIQSQRESFMREVAATRTKARWLVWLGLIAMLAGIGIFFWAFAGQFTAIANAFGSMDPSSFDGALGGFGQEIFGINAFILGLGLAGIGQTLLIVGIIMHIVATARRRRADRDFTVPAPWMFPNQG